MKVFEGQFILGMALTSRYEVWDQW
jgi:hypothetical protein